MKALILNSGVGRRLRPFSDKMPKCLLKLNDKSILDVQLDNLGSCGIDRIIITTGPFEEQIKSSVEVGFPNFDVEYVSNPKYESTNYIYSIWLARELIDDDIVLLHGDLVFERILLERLLKKTQGNFVLVNKKIPPPEKDFKALVQNNRVKKIGVNLLGKGALFCAPLYKFSKSDFLIWIDEMERFISLGKVNCYAEDALNEISDKLELIPFYYGAEFCMEVDSMEDLEVARLSVPFAPPDKMTNRTMIKADGH